MKYAFSNEFDFRKCFKLTLLEIEKLKLDTVVFFGCFMTDAADIDQEGMKIFP